MSLASFSIEFGWFGFGAAWSPYPLLRLGLMQLWFMWGSVFRRFEADRNELREALELARNERRAARRQFEN